MSFWVRSVVAAIVLGISFVPASAQDKFPFVEKSVWTVTYVETKPGRFNPYIDDLSKVWQSYLKRMKADGHVLSYKILAAQFVRDNEPNLMLMVEYKNMAAFDAGTAYWERITKEVAGSIDKADKATINREELRKVRGTTVLREIDFAP